MKESVISFVSSRKRGFHPELSALKDQVTDGAKDLSFRYFLKADQTGNFLVNKGVSFEKEAFCKQADAMVCIDDSLPENFVAKEQQNAVLFAIPFDYQFKRILEAESGKSINNTDFKKYSYLVTGSRFTSDVLKQCYDTAGITLVEDVCYPLGWNITRPEAQEEVAKRLSSYFPSMKGKKILSIITGGKKGDEGSELLEWNLKEILDALKEDWFVFTNDSVLHEQSQALPVNYIQSFGYVKDIVAANKLLYVTDVLVTNIGSFATSFAAKRQPIYWMKHKDNPFEQYMKKHYANLDFSQVINNKFADLEVVNQELCEYFSYAPQQDPGKKVLELLNY